MAKKVTQAEKDRRAAQSAQDKARNRGAPAAVAAPAAKKPVVRSKAPTIKVSSERADVEGGQAWTDGFVVPLLTAPELSGWDFELTSVVVVVEPGAVATPWVGQVFAGLTESRPQAANVTMDAVRGLDKSVLLAVAASGQKRVSLPFRKGDSRRRGGTLSVALTVDHDGGGTKHLFQVWVESTYRLNGRTASGSLTI